MKSYKEIHSNENFSLFIWLWGISSVHGSPLGEDQIVTWEIKQKEAKKPKPTKQTKQLTTKTS